MLCLSLYRSKIENNLQLGAVLLMTKATESLYCAGFEYLKKLVGLTKLVKVHVDYEVSPFV